MGFSCGIVGLPNVGKSTIFNALTRSKAEAANYPFTTIDPNTGIVAVPDKRLDIISQFMPALKVVPTAMQFVDIAGLVKGASQGEGLGNKFLGHIREVTAIAHVVRCFADDNIVHVSGKIDPINDIEVINTELMIADIESLQRRKQKLEKGAKSGDKEARFQLPIIEQIDDALNRNLPARSLKFDGQAEAAFVRTLSLLSAKPVLYICNVAEPAETDNIYVQKVKDLASRESAEVVALAAKLEQEILEIDDPGERAAFLKEMGMEEPGLHRVIHAGYALLDLITYFTSGGGKENRAWTIQKNFKAPQAAGVIHSDFEKGFIRAQVYHFDDLVRLKSEQAVREAGLLRSEGKDYIVRDGDIIEFLFNV